MSRNWLHTSDCKLQNEMTYTVAATCAVLSFASVCDTIAANFHFAILMVFDRTVDLTA